MSYSPIPDHPGESWAPPPEWAPPGASPPPPPPERRTVLPTLAVLVVVALIAAVSVAATRTPQSPPGIAGYLPTGTHEDVMTDAVDGGLWQTGQTVVGGSGLAELSAPIRDAIAPVDTTTSRWLLVDGMRSDRNGGFTTLAFRVGNGLTWDGFEGNLGWTAFQPGLPALTTDLLAGQEVSWDGTLSAPGREPGPARATIRPETDVDLGCLRVRAELAFPEAAGAIYRFRWCRGIGLSGWSLATDTGSVAAGFEDRRGEFLSGDVDLAEPDLPRPSGGRVDRVRFVRQVGASLFPYEQLTGISIRQAGGAVVIADSEGTLTGWRPLPVQRTGEIDYGLLWRARPGGSIRGLVSVGDLVVAGTTGRRIVAYEPNGRLVWSQTVPDAVTGIARHAGLVVVSEANGSLRALDAATGETRWEDRIGEHDRAPVTGGAGDAPGAPGTVAVVTADEIQVRDLDTGKVRWSAAADPRRTEVAVAGDLVLVRVDGWLIARSAVDGAVRWTRPVTVGSLLSGSDRFVVAYARGGTTAFDLDGTGRWTAPGTRSGGVRGDRALLTKQDGIELRRLDGSSVSWAYPDGFVVPEVQPGPVPGGFLTLQRSPTGLGWWQYT